MAITRTEESRALNADEMELVEKSHHPDVQELSDKELGDLVRLLRDRRDKAQSEANRRRREMRGKSSAKGARASADDTGSRLKTEVLAMAMRRLNNEAQRRERLAARAELAENAQNALEMRQQAMADAPARGGGRTASKGMKANESGRARRITAPKKVGSVSQRTKNAQAKRDSR